MSLKRAPGVIAGAAKEQISANPVKVIKISQIVAPQKHDRSQYDEEAILWLSKNIEKMGLLQPIVVRQLEKDRYERVSGFRRLKAVELLGWTEIMARVIDADDLGALKAMLSENTAREDLNAYDKAVFFEEIILAALSFSSNETLRNTHVHELKRRLQRMRNRGLGRIVEPKAPEEEEFEKIISTSVLGEYGFGLDSFVKFMGILDFHELIVEAIRRNGIDRSVAAEINRLSAKNPEKIPEVIEFAEKHKASKREVAEMVNRFIKESKESRGLTAKGLLKAIGVKKIPQKNKKRLEEIATKFIEEVRALTVSIDEKGL